MAAAPSVPATPSRGWADSGTEAATGPPEVRHRIAALAEQQQVEQAGDRDQQPDDADQRPQRRAVALAPAEQQQPCQQEDRRRHEADEADHGGQAGIDPLARRAGPAEVRAEQGDDAECQEADTGEVGAVVADELLRLRAPGRPARRAPLRAAWRGRAGVLPAGRRRTGLAALATAGGRGRSGRGLGRHSSPNSNSSNIRHRRTRQAPRPSTPRQPRVTSTSDARGQTSRTTGTIIGLRRVRSFTMRPAARRIRCCSASSSTGAAASASSHLPADGAHRFVEQVLRLGRVDPAPGDQLGPRDDGPLLGVDRHDDDHDALLGQHPAVPQHPPAHVADDAVDVEVAGPHPLTPQQAAVGQHDLVAVLADERCGPAATPTSSARRAWAARCRASPCTGTNHSGRVRLRKSRSSSCLA